MDKTTLITCGNTTINYPSGFYVTIIKRFTAENKANCLITNVKIMSPPFALHFGLCLYTCRPSSVGLIKQLVKVYLSYKNLHRYVDRILSLVRNKIKQKHPPCIACRPVHIDYRMRFTIKVLYFDQFAELV